MFISTATCLLDTTCGVEHSDCDWCKPQGFQRVADSLADTALDNPRAKGEFPTIVEAAQRGGWLESGFEVCSVVCRRSPACFALPCTISADSVTTALTLCREGELQQNGSR